MSVQEVSVKSGKEKKIIRQNNPQIPTGLTSVMTSDLIIIDFLREEYLRDQNSFISFYTIALTKDMAERLANSLANFISLGKDQDD